MSASLLDGSVTEAAADLTRAGVPAPDVLCLLATGLGLLPGRLERASRLPLSRTPGVPPSWSQAVLHSGRIGGRALWLLEAAHQPREEEAPWAAAFPVWLAAASGARVVLHASAGASLGPWPTGALALVSDHVNLSGSTPLAGLGESRLGPLFPDQTRTYHPRLCALGQRLGAKLGLDARPAVAALSLGPAQETPAEARWYARAGADVVSSDLSASALAASHAGASLFAVVAVAGRAGEATDVAQAAAVARALEPALDEFLGLFLAELAAHWGTLLESEEPA
jgi:purine-nucleoside phosphorylase